MRLLLISTLLSFMLTNCPSESDTELMDMTATVSPQEAGEVNPPTGTYFSGREITVETEPADSQWVFTGWTGDTTASDDSLAFAITRDMQLIANYEQGIAEEFSNSITVSDGINSRNVIFGMRDEATAGFDSGIDQELPNMAPPEGAFYRRFNIPDYALKDDYRAIRDQQTIWELEYAPEVGRMITLSWDFSESLHVGSLILADDPENPTFQLDMKSENSFEVSDPSLRKLYIISN